MKKQFESAIELILKQDINGCIAGSALLGYQEQWEEKQDIDIFCYDKSSFNKILYFMYYHPMFTVLDNLEVYKIKQYIDEDKSSLDSIGLITLKFTWNLCIPVNIVYKKFQKDIFSVLSAFDIDVISQGIDIKTGKKLSLRESSGMKGTWNTWNTSYYKSDMWSCKRLLRQFSRTVKYSNRGYDLTEVTDKYIELVEDILSKENIYKTERGTDFYEKTQKEFELVLKILKSYKKDSKITSEELLILKTLI